jgi:hypothetical protein
LRKVLPEGQALSILGNSLNVVKSFLGYSRN